MGSCRVLAFACFFVLGVVCVFTDASRINGRRGMGPVDDRRPSATEGKERILENMRNLRGTYNPRFAFPRWVVETYAAQHFGSYHEDASKCAIFYDEGDSRENVLALATQREPVNIGMNRPYNLSNMMKHFGWGTGRYGELADEALGVLPPNIAIMCPTPVVSSLYGPDEELRQFQDSAPRSLDDIQQAEEMSQFQDPSKRVYILSVIAYAFDNRTHPDQIHFLGQSEGKLEDAKSKELISRYEQIFDKVFAAAIHYNRNVIVLSKFGAGAFSQNFPGMLFEEIWMPAFRKVLSAWAKKLKKAKVTELSLMGGEREVRFVKVVRSMGFSSELYKFFPDPIRSQLGRKLDGTMFVNAWDSWSIIGNGNFADNSLDGFVGRTTALAVLGWPLTNPHLQANMISVARPA